MKLIRWWWVVVLALLACGLARLHFDTEVLDLLPPNLPSVEGLKLYQRYFTNARELLVTIQAPDADTAETAAKSIAAALRQRPDLADSVLWQPPWMETPGLAGEMTGYLWYNQPPQVFTQQADALAPPRLQAQLQATSEAIATTASPADMERLGHDPYQFTQLPGSLRGLMLESGASPDAFEGSEGSFRVVFVRARDSLGDDHACAQWLKAVDQVVRHCGLPPDQVRIRYTGRPAFVAEIAASMRHDIIESTCGTAFMIAILFWLAHRRLKPMLWLLALLALILIGTLAAGGLVFGSISVISMGFAAILLGLAVDYAVVHYQEALAQPTHSIPRIRRAIAPAIFWAATTTICSFLSLDLGGLPGLAQLGSLVAMGVCLSALFMIYAYLPPLFPHRMKEMDCQPEPGPKEQSQPAPMPRFLPGWIGASCLTAAGALLSLLVLVHGFPLVDTTADALRPRDSQAYAAMDAIQANMTGTRSPVWLVVSGKNETGVGSCLDQIRPVLQEAVSQGSITSFILPDAVWPRPEWQKANRDRALDLVAEKSILHQQAAQAGFSGSGMGLTDEILDTWSRATKTPGVFWPTNSLSSWILGRLAVRTGTNCVAVAYLFPANDKVDWNALQARLPPGCAYISSWQILGTMVYGVVRSNLWKLLAPMVVLILCSLSLAFRRLLEIILSLAVLCFSLALLLSLMKLLGWKWNLLNLMALPLILGTGVDYGIFMQLALARYEGNRLMAHHSVGRALLLCGATAVAGFGSLGFSSNLGMASLGRICAMGIACNMLVSIYLLPAWWKHLTSSRAKSAKPNPSGPPSLYQASFWKLGLWTMRWLPTPACHMLARAAATLAWIFAPGFRRVTQNNLLPVKQGDSKAAQKAARQLFTEFTLKLCDLWKYEGGSHSPQWFVNWEGWDIFKAASARGRGVLLVSPHLGNWELGGPFMVRHGCQLMVLTQEEPDPRMTRLREASRRKWGVETLVVGRNAFAMLDIVKKLQAGANVALLVDRPHPATAVPAQLFGQSLSASIAPAELARASGCAIVPTFIIREKSGYRARILPEITYDRTLLGNRQERAALAEKILRAFEPAIRQHADQWFHFVPIWRANVDSDMASKH